MFLEVANPTKVFLCSMRYFTIGRVEYITCYTGQIDSKAAETKQHKRKYLQVLRRPCCSWVRNIAFT